MPKHVYHRRSALMIEHIQYIVVSSLEPDNIFQGYSGRFVLKTHEICATRYNDHINQYYGQSVLDEKRLFGLKWRG